MMKNQSSSSLSRKNTKLTIPFFEKLHVLMFFNFFEERIRKKYDQMQPLTVFFHFFSIYFRINTVFTEKARNFIF